MWSTRRARRFRVRAEIAAAILFGWTACVPALAEDGSPLDRLRERSADVRWQQHRHQWLAPSQIEADSAPAAADVEPEAASPEPSVEPETTDEEWPRAHPLFEPVESAPQIPADASGSAPADAAAPAVNSDPGDIAPPAPRAVATNSVSALPTPQTGGAASLHSLPETVRQPLPQSPFVIPLPDYLNGAGPLWLAPRLRAAARPEQSRGDVAGIAGSQLTAVQEQPADPFETRERGMLRPITDISPFLDYDPDGGDACQYLCPTPPAICGTDADHLCPEEEPLPESGSAERYFAHMNYFWLASNVHYNPLYFEDPALERYGHVHLHDTVQPFCSVARFGGQLIGLPYQMALQPVHDRVYPLGYFRPGDPAPKLIYQPPLNARAGAVATGVYTGLFFLVP